MKKLIILFSLLLSISVFGEAPCVTNTCWQVFNQEHICFEDMFNITETTNNHSCGGWKFGTQFVIYGNCADVDGATYDIDHNTVTTSTMNPVTWVDLRSDDDNGLLYFTIWVQCSNGSQDHFDCYIPEGYTWAIWAIGTDCDQFGACHICSKLLLEGISDCDILPPEP